MISEAYLMMVNGTLNAASQGIPQNTAVVVNGGGVSLPSTIPPNTIIFNGTAGTLAPQPVVSNAVNTALSSDPERPFACEVCGTRYKSKPGLTYHRKNQHGIGQKAHHVNQTSMSVVNSAYGEILAANGAPPGAPDAATAAAVAALASSAANTSGGVLPSMQIITDGALAPMTTQQTLDLKPYTCEACGMKYKSKPGLNYHRLHVHLENTKSQSMVAESSYTELLRSQPGGANSENALALASSMTTPSNSNGATDAERPYICEICGAKYKSKPGLAYHRTRTHQDDKPQSFHCPTCGATYKSKPGLAYHKIHAHPELVPLKH